MPSFTPMDFINRELNSIDMVPMKDFMMRYQESFEPDLDLEFMDYFLELSKRENRDQFIVHHDKLFEYGITVDNESSNTRKRIIALGLVEDIDYLLGKVSEQLPSGAKTKNIYHFTPRVFKKILLSARPHARHEINVERYRDYYLFLEEVVGYYNEYQVMYEQRRNAMITKENKSLKEMVSAQSHKLDAQSHKLDAQSAQFAELLGYAKSTTEKLDEVKDELIETKEEVILSKTYLEEKSFHSTMNPSNDSLHHAVAATKYDNKNEKCVKVITGQRKYVDKTVQKNLDNGHTLAIDTFYNANGIDLRQNTCDAFKRKRKEVVIAYNAKQVAEAKAFNSKLRKEINAYNKKNPDTQRIYVKEKMTPQKISIGDITVKFSKLAFSYTENPYMSFDEVLQIIIDTNQATQVSPLASSDSE
jgi:hypothetical protein